MAEFEARFEDKQVQDFISNLKRNLKRVKDGEKQYAGLISSHVFKDVVEHFEKEEGSEGPWKKWSKAYEAARMSSFANKTARLMHRMISGKTEKSRASAEKSLKSMGPPKILQMTGKLRQNFKPTKYRSDRDGLYWFNDAKTKGGFPYAFAHNEGGGKLPRRDFMWLSDQAVEKIAKDTLNFMLEKGIK